MDLSYRYSLIKKAVCQFLVYSEDYIQEGHKKPQGSVDIRYGKSYNRIQMFTKSSGRPIPANCCNVRDPVAIGEHINRWES